MKILVIRTSAKLAEHLTMKENKPNDWQQMTFSNERYCGRWEK
jgi:hypothetical protein